MDSKTGRDYWLEVSVEVEEETAEIASTLLRPFAPNDAVVLEQRGDADNLDPYALEPGVTVKIYLPGEEDSDRLRQSIAAALAQMDLPAPTFRELEENDWANAWKEHFRPFPVGERIWVQPGWLEAEDRAPDDIVITLDPGMAFGTGAHQTTQLCLAALEKYIAEGDTVLDVGTGSGILAITAVKLGASEVVALDTDRQAVKATIENAAVNNVAPRIRAYEGTLADLSPKKRHWNIVLVNILAPVILDLFEQDNLIDYPAENGRLILSGLIEDQVVEVGRRILSAGGQIVEKMSMGEWVSLIVKRIG